MTYKDAIALYKQGPRTTIAVLLQLWAEKESLRARTIELEALLAAKDVQPTTPSGAIPPYQKENISRRGRRKRPGRKEGHPGIGRKTPDRIDQTKEHHLEVCPDCGGAVTEMDKPRVRFVEGIRPLQSEVTKHSIFRCYCPKCQKIVEPRVTAALPKSQITLYTFVLGAWLHYHVGMSLSNLVMLFSLSGLSITAGALTQAWRTLATLLSPAYDQIRQKVKTSAVLHGDETGWRISGVTHWLWYFGTKVWAYYVIDRRRSQKVVLRVLGKILSGILICDFWGAYNVLEAAAKQRCMYHLFTELGKVDIRNRHPAWRAFRKKLCRLIRDAIRLGAQHGKLDGNSYARCKGLILKRLDILIATPVDDKDAHRLIKRLRRHKNELFVFLDHPETVSPYNNHGEQQMRKPVLTRRISHGNRSQLGAEAQAILMSLFRSMELHNLDPIQAVLRLAEDAIAGREVSVDSVLLQPSRNDVSTSAQAPVAQPETSPAYISQNTGFLGPAAQAGGCSAMSDTPNEDAMVPSLLEPQMSTQTADDGTPGEAAHYVHSKVGNVTRCLAVAALCLTVGSFLAPEQNQWPNKLHEHHLLSAARERPSAGFFLGLITNKVHSAARSDMAYPVRDSIFSSLEAVCSFRLPAGPPGVVLSSWTYRAFHFGPGPPI
jgi:transposase